MQNIMVDIAQSGVASTLLFKQGDVNRTFQVTVTDNGLPYPVENAEMVSVWYSGSSGEGIYTDAGEESACTVEGNVITVKVLAPLVIKKGAGTLCLMLSHPDGTQLGLWNIIYHVEGVPGYESPETMNYYNALGRIMEQTKQLAEEIRESVENIETDETLSVSGVAADAAAVGRQFEEVNNKFGTDETLSVSGVAADAAEVGRQLEEVNNRFETDVYFTLPGVPADAAAVGDALYTKLSFMNDLYHSGCYQVGDDLNWLNPAMELMRTYDMVFRYMGSTVWAQLCNYGALPNGGSKNVSSGIPANAKVVSYKFIITSADGNTVYINPHKIDGVELALMTYNNDGIQLSVTTSGDLSGYSAKCLVEYTND